ncbi:hypothetical protein GCM10018781_61330 [Kitasatospora indigofera]|uniref:Uncharacterized protein n=1 Tax=Kitasatospora indigofera TaxID=67307 RepID=A0A919G9R3_9ACTN|nr:hypothetical protein GCM10018781_61330 [Kitasatospora indigofera]
MRPHPYGAASAALLVATGFGLTRSTVSMPADRQAGEDDGVSGRGERVDGGGRRDGSPQRGNEWRLTAAPNRSAQRHGRSMIVETPEPESKVHGLETALAVQEANLFCRGAGHAGGDPGGHELDLRRHAPRDLVRDGGGLRGPGRRPLPGHGHRQAPTVACWGAGFARGAPAPADPVHEQKPTYLSVYARFMGKRCVSTPFRRSSWRQPTAARPSRSTRT